MAWAQYRIRGSFNLKIMLTVLLVALGDFMFFQQGLHGGAFGLYGLAMLIALALTRPAVVRSHATLGALAAATLFAMAMTYSAGFLPWTLFWIAAGMATLLPRTAHFDDGWRWFQRLLFQAFSAIPGPIPDFIRRASMHSRRRVTKGGLRKLLPIIILPALGSCIFAALFAAANPVIESWFKSLSTPQFDFQFVLRILLWTVLTWFAWSLMRPRLKLRLFGTFDGRGDLHIPGLSASSIVLSLIAFNALFLMQNAMDAAWLWGLLPLPDGLTLAAYAHRGAYPLIVTALLAALFVLVALRPGSTTANIGLVRVLVSLWIAQNLFLVFNAALRTLDYIAAYSLTVLRISALLWMGIVALGLVLVLWRMLSDKSAAWLINSNLAAVGILLTAVCFVDLGAISAQWNIRHAREMDGDGAVLDLCYMNQIRGSALLPMITLEQQLRPGALRQRVHNARVTVHHLVIDDVNRGGWDWLSTHRLNKARQMLGGTIEPRPIPDDYDCNGYAYGRETLPTPAPPPLPLEPAHPISPALTKGADR